MMRDPEKTVGNILDRQSIVYVSSVDEEGFPRTRAMGAPRVREGIKEFYFSTNTSSSKVDLFRKNPKASIYFCDKRFYRGVLLKGNMEVLDDVDSKEMIWQPKDTMFYPGGVTDKDYCVLKFTAMGGRYFSNGKTEEFIIE